MRTANDEIYIMTNRTGYIPQIRACGPILQPIAIPVSLALSMVSSGVTVYEVDPETKTNILLTPQNIMDDTKFQVKDVAPVVEPTVPKDVTPVAEPETPDEVAPVEEAPKEEPAAVEAATEDSDTEETDSTAAGSKKKNKNK